MMDEANMFPFSLIFIVVILTTVFGVIRYIHTKAKKQILLLRFIPINYSLTGNESG